MTQREGLVSVAAPELASSGVAALPLRRSWEEVVDAATPAVQDQLLALARSQRLPGTPQPPRSRNGHTTHHGDAALVLDGRTHNLKPVLPEPVDFCDTSLDEAQREAVARAIATPDLFLLQGLPGTGKSRVVAEIVMQAAMRGDRILLLAPTAAPIDRILEWVGERDAVCPIRCLGADERLETLPASSRSLTFGERLRHLGEQPQAAAQQEVTVLEQRCQRRKQDDMVLARLQTLAERARELEEAQRVLREQITATVVGEADAAERGVAGAGEFAAQIATACADHRQLLAQHDAKLQDLRIRVEGRRHEQTALQARLDSLRAMAESRERRRWWTLAWWRAVFHGNVRAELAALEASARQAESDLHSLAEELQIAEEARTQAEAAYQQERASRIDAETAARHDHDNQARARSEETKTLAEQWHLASAEVDAGVRPEAMTVAAMDQALAVANRLLQGDEEQLASARQWLTCVEQARATLPERLVRHANFVAATTAALPADRHFGAADGFDLLIVQDADQVPKADFLALARRAARCVLVSEAQVEDKGGPAHTSARQGFFRDLWHALHCNPRTRSCTWIQDRYRLSCKLRPVAPEQRQWLDCERVADAPDIELRILMLPRAEPMLAEVVFPASMSIAQAKAYLFREMQELPVSAGASDLRWSGAADKLLLHLGPAAAETTRVCLEPGVHEIICAHAVGSNGDQAKHWTTARIEFDGWSHARAQEWLARHLGLRDLGRTVRLDVPHRMHPELAAFVSELLFAGAYRMGEAPANGAVAHIEFISVAAPQAKPEARGRGQNGKHANHRQTNGAALPKVGAGLELDLSDRRHRERLPTELRPGLPDHGFVNYGEAQAVVRHLEQLASEAGKSSVAVMALYPAQAALIRNLMKQSPTLSASAFMPAVDVPGAFRQREFATVLLSLTRSHLHRAVSFGDGPAQLGLALTRARSKLVLFGDPGTLARRCQWSGAVDHLDEATAGRERDILAQLLRYLEGQGPHQRAFLLHSGNRA